MLELARLLEAESTVRSAARLSRERPEQNLSWTASWMISAQDLFEDAYLQGQLNAGVRPASLVSLSTYLTVGVECRARAEHEDPPARDREPSTADELKQVWDMIQYGICRPPASDPDRSKMPAIRIAVRNRWTI